MGFLKRIVDKIDPSVDGQEPIKEKVETLVANTFQVHADMKETQAEALYTAAREAEEKAERERFLKLAREAKEQALEAKMEVMVRQEYLQSRVDVRTGRL